MAKKGPPVKYNPIEIEGKIINGFKVICHAYDDIKQSNSHPTWTITRHYVKCICPVCGKEFITRYENISSGRIKSCGCVKIEKARIRLGDIARTHGKRYTRLYRVWMGMRMRCYNPNCKSYPEYGSRGIYICDEWMEEGPNNPGFMNFYNWAYANGYYDQPKGTSQKDILTIDRIDVNGPYAPWNCQWVTRKVQGNNTTRNNYIIDITGKRLSLAEFSEKYNVHNKYIIKRRQSGWSDAAIIYAITHPDLEIHRPHNQYIDDKDVVYRDKDGFQVLIPSLEIQMKWNNKNK